MTLRLVSSNENEKISNTSNFEKLEKSLRWNCHVATYAFLTKQWSVGFKCLRNGFMSPSWISMFLSGLAWYQSKNKEVWKPFRFSYLLGAIMLGIIGTVSDIEDMKEYGTSITSIEDVDNYLEWLKTRY